MHTATFISPRVRQCDAPVRYAMIFTAHCHAKRACIYMYTRIWHAKAIVCPALHGATKLDNTLRLPSDLYVWLYLFKKFATKRREYVKKHSVAAFSFEGFVRTTLKCVNFWLISCSLFCLFALTSKCVPTTISQLVFSAASFALRRVFCSK